jgi:propionyl-CoA carboxylase alpha chain
MPTLSRVLVANRGEIARRVFRTCRQMGIGTAAVYADPDRDAPYAREADVAVALGGTTPAETYLAIDKLLGAAKRAGADAVHPGYGFLAEDAGFAQAVIDAGLVWVGPAPASIAAMGDKLHAKRLAAQAGVPTLPGQTLNGLGPAGFAQAAATIGWPLLVKAAGGGGGRGMRIIREAASLSEAVVSARREAGAAFGNDEVFLERYLEAPRHVEVQILGDQHGTLVHLFERECSIQRRHQKIIEEAPSPALDATLRARMTQAALAIAGAIGYTNAGTVEFLVDGGGEFYFLEVNTRIQVEHPVTEAVTGIDLIREQLLVAQGERLSVRPDEVILRGHAIEARLYAEDPSNGFLPTGGRLLDWQIPRAVDVRVDSGVDPGTEIALGFDPMIAKLITHAPTRREAALRLALALEQLVAPGVVTNRDFLVNVLRHPAFLAQDTTTDFIERHRPVRRREPEDQARREAALAAALAAQVARRSAARVLTTLPSGWRNNASGFQEVHYRFGSREVQVGYRRQRDGAFDCLLDGAPVRARIVGAALPSLDLEIDGRRRAFRVTAGPAGALFVQDGAGELSFHERPRFPEPETTEVAGGYAAPMPGRVLEVAVAAGDRVAKGQRLLTLEAMKMELPLSAAMEGVVAEVRVSVGQQVDAGQVLVVLEGQGGSKDP